MELVKTLGAIALALCSIAACILLVVIFIHGTAWALNWVMQVSSYVTTICSVLCLLVFAPTALHWRTRKFSAYGFFICAVIFLNVDLAFGFLVTYAYWGVIGAFIGVVSGVILLIPNGDACRSPSQRLGNRDAVCVWPDLCVRRLRPGLVDG